MRDDDGGYTLSEIRGCLLNLHELRELGKSSLQDETPKQARERQKLMDMLVDVETAMKQLPKGLKLAVYWRYEETLPERESASHVGITLTPLQNRIARAELFIQNFLNGVGQTPQKFTLTNMEGKK